MASEAIKRDHISNMHIDMQVIEVTDFKSDVRFHLLGSLAARL